MQQPRRLQSLSRKLYSHDSMYDSTNMTEKPTQLHAFAPYSDLRDTAQGDDSLAEYLQSEAYCARLDIEVHRLQRQTTVLAILAVLLFLPLAFLIMRLVSSKEDARPFRTVSTDILFRAFQVSSADVFVGHCGRHSILTTELERVAGEPLERPVVNAFCCLLMAGRS